MPFVNLDGETGLVVESGDPDALAAAMRRLLSDAKLRSRFGEAGRRRAEGLFSRPVMVRDCLSLYADLLGDNGPGAPAAFGARAARG